jgi:hypothetical protein
MQDENPNVNNRYEGVLQCVYLCRIMKQTDMISIVWFYASLECLSF